MIFEISQSQPHSKQSLTLLDKLDVTIKEDGLLPSTAGTPPLS